MQMVIKNLFAYIFYNQVCFNSLNTNGLLLWGYQLFLSITEIRILMRSIKVKRGSRFD